MSGGLWFSAVAMIAAPDARWSAALAAAAFGALAYTLVQSPGYYVERRNPGMVAMFGGFWVVTLAFLALLITSINIFGGFAVTQRMLGMFRK